jgi:dTMP kinase
MLINNNENTAASTSTTVARRGAFVVLEGVDRCGKTTQSGLLLKKLLAASFSAAAMRFPDRTTATGQLIDSYLQNNSNSQLDDRAVHLLFSANRWEACHHLERQLAAGTTVVCDRYAYSGVAFSGAKVLKDGVTPALPLEWCKAPDVGLPAPDCVIFLDLQPDEAEARGGCVYYTVSYRVVSVLEEFTVFFLLCVCGAFKSFI